MNIWAIVLALTLLGATTQVQAAPHDLPGTLGDSAEGYATGDGAEVRASQSGNTGSVSGRRDRGNRGTGEGSGGSGGGSGSSAAAAEAAQAEAARLAACRAQQQAVRDARTGPDGPVLTMTLCDVAGDGATAGGAAVVLPDPEVVARQAMLRLPIPLPEAKIGPPPEINEWNMAAVGYPLWLWVEGPDIHTATITERGITLTMTARRVTTRFDLGDGTVIACGMTPVWYFEVEPGTPSPGCGHRYRQPAPQGETYPVVATTVWRVTWTALGRSGTLPLERTGPAYRLPVGELHALRTR